MMASKAHHVKQTAPHMKWHDQRKYLLSHTHLKKTSARDLSPLNNSQYCPLAYTLSKRRRRAAVEHSLRVHIFMYLYASMRLYGKSIASSSVCKLAAAHSLAHCSLSYKKQVKEVETERTTSNGDAAYVAFAAEPQKYEIREVISDSIRSFD